MTASFGTMQPNSVNQRWSRWSFTVAAEPPRLPDVSEVVDNARRFFAKGFQSHAGRVRVDQQGNFYMIVVEIEGPPVHDLAYRDFVRSRFIEHFMWKGFGGSSRLTAFEAGLLAGSEEDGSPPAQLIVLPTLDLPNRGH